MSKRIKLIGAFLIMALLVSLVSVVPLFSATSGTVDILDAAGGDEIAWTNPGATIWLHVEDADLDVAVKAVLTDVEDPDDYPTAVLGEDVTADVGTTTGVKYVTLDSIPILDSGVADMTIVADRIEGDPDGFVNKKDVKLVGCDPGPTCVIFGDYTGALDATVQTLSADGLAQVNVTTASTYTTVYALYWGSGANNTADAVVVKSQQDETGITFELTETTATSGIFEASLAMCQGVSVTGTATVADAAGGTLTDGTADFVVAGVIVGDVVHNTTDGSWGVITALTATTITATLAGGTEDDWDIGDAYRTVCSTEDTSIWVADDDVITVEYTDADPSRTASTTVVVESTAPTFANLSPVDGYATAITRPYLSGNVTDADSGVLQDEDVEETIRFVMRITNLAETTVLDGPEVVDPVVGGTVEEITGGFSSVQRVPYTLTALEDVYLIQWWVLAKDVAGNVGVSDEDDTTDCTPPATVAAFDPAAAAGCDPYVVRVDFEDPELDEATTGNWWDAEAEAVKFGADAVNTSIEVVFTEALDGDSISVTDFDSDDVDIEAAQWFAGAPDRVFLTVDPMDSDLEPDIEVVSSIKDEAGNAMTAGEVEADDGLPANLTVTVVGTAGSRPATNETITITVQSDEAMTTTPAVEAKAVEDDWTITGGDLAGTPTLVATRTWKVEIDFTAAQAGLYNVFVSGMDLGALITAMEGVATGSVEDDDDAILFEVDTAVAAPAFTPADEGTTDNPDTFIIVDFADEGKEYGLDALDAFTDVPADVVTTFDTHGTVTVTEATLDGEDITLMTADDIVFLARPGDLELGEHTIAVTAEDAVGNEGEFEATFTVTERAAYELPLKPGLNLVSLPGNPASTAIDDVLGDVTSVDLVVSYEVLVAGFARWRTAERNSTTGLFEGTLSKIDGQHAYWMRTDTFVDVEAVIAPLAYNEVPPTIPVSKGWNLVPVTDVALSDAGTEIPADDYLASITWTVGWTFDTLANAWERIVYGATSNVEVGRGYWVWASSAGTIVP